MNRTELANVTKRLAERAAQASGKPSDADIAEAKALFDLRKEFLSNEISSNIKVKFHEEPDWNSWSSIADFFTAYHTALVDLQNRLAIPLAEGRLEGI